MIAGKRAEEQPGELVPDHVLKAVTRRETRLIEPLQRGTILE